MPKQIKLPQYVYNCIEKYGNVDLPLHTGFTIKQIKNHLEYKCKCKIKIREWKYMKPNLKDGNYVYIDSYIAEVSKHASRALHTK